MWVAREEKKRGARGEGGRREGGIKGDSLDIQSQKIRLYPFFFLTLLPFSSSHPFSLSVSFCSLLRMDNLLHSVTMTDIFLIYFRILEHSSHRLKETKNLQGKAARV